jgi:hypothetical protein
VGGCDVGGSAAASLDSTASPPTVSVSVAETNVASLRLRVRCFAANVFCFACAMFFFMSHTYHCRPYHYSVFSLFEWATVVTNIMFHAVAATDMGESRLIFVEPYSSAAALLSSLSGGSQAASFSAHHP